MKKISKFIDDYVWPVFVFLLVTAFVIGAAVASYRMKVSIVKEGYKEAIEEERRLHP